MLIKVWGSRGSIPVCGREYLRYGGDTTCLEIRTKSGDTFIVDAGTGIRRLGNQLLIDQRYVYHFLITHGHWDHLMGFPFFKPLYLDQVTIRVHRCPFPKKFVESKLSNVMTPPNFPIRPSELRAKIIYEDGNPTRFEVGSMAVETIPLSHPNMGSGYKFIEDGKIFVFLTDNELGFIHPGGLPKDQYIEFAYGADLLFHDAEYTPEEYESKVLWGHSDYVEAVDLAIQAGVKRLGLFHLYQERSDEEVDQIVDQCQKIISAAGHSLECFGVAADMIFEL
ncbi:MAG: MBL fold metallo-hydrolase [Desulfosarcina sp.]|nr:MBL fold metallo-hydrolase [Desulfobacterales bacterium]